MSEDPGAPSPGPLAFVRGTVAVALLAFAAALLLLSAGPDWARGVAGGGDAWQNLWNLRHVDRALHGGTPLYRTDRLWFPEGAGLGMHTLAPALTVPGALAGRFVGFTLGYDLTVALTFVLAAAGTYRLGRRLGIGPAGAAAAALVFAFAPPRVARAYGHLNLLGLGFLPFALEGLVLASRRRGRARFAGILEAAAALAALALTDLYLALLGAVAAGCLAAFEIVRAPRGERVPRLASLAAAGLASLVFASPQLRATSRDASDVVPQHESRWCSVAATSLVIPSRIQVASALTRPLTERNHQNLVEGVGYLGFVPLLATLAVVVRRRPRDLDFALVAGALGLALSLGPRLRVFDTLLDVPLPYAALEAALPALRLGGCVNRFEQLAFLPLALGLGFWLDRRRAEGTGRALTLAALALAALEYLPWRIPVESWPIDPPDPAIVAIKQTPGAGAVLDLDMGTAALVRQMIHGRPITFGYLSRTPRDEDRQRREDPVLGPLLAADGRPPGSPASAAAALRDRWGVTHVVGPATDAWKARAAAFGLLPFAESDRTAVFVPAPASGR